MLNLFFKKQNKIDNKMTSLKEKKNKLGYVRHFPPANKEWNNSIYAYNKNVIKLLPFYSKTITSLIKSYFYLYSKEEETIRSRRMRVRLKRLSTNRILISKAEVKHTNAKTIITIYIYNGQLRYFFNKLKDISAQNYLNDEIKTVSLQQEEIAEANKVFLDKIKLVKDEGIKMLKQTNEKRNDKITLLSKTTKWKRNLLEDSEITDYTCFVKNLLKKEMLIMHYKRLLFFNMSKFENTLILPLSNIISNIYHKNVEFNLVNLKYLHLNSDILSEFIVTKLRKRKNRLLNILGSCLNIIKVPAINKLYERYSFNMMDKTFNPFLFNKVNKSIDLLDQLLNNIFPQEKHKKAIETTIIDSIKHKWINGVRIEASGRLTKRFTASRSLFKFRYKGSLKNIDSSYKGLSSVMLRGHTRSNIQYTKNMSKTRSGSYGLKGWISSN